MADEAHELTGDDEGKTVLDPEGEPLGEIDTVDDGTAYVAPERDLTDEIKGWLGLGDGDGENDETFPLPQGRIESITADEVRLEN